MNKTICFVPDKKKSKATIYTNSWDCIVIIVIHCELGSWGYNPDGGEIFCIHPSRPQGPPSLLYDGYQVSFLGVKQPGHGIN